jgi:hypothetical protein
MVDEILTAAGVLHKQARFVRLPDETHAVWFDDVSADGPDGYNRIFTHDVTVELYAPKPDPKTEEAIEAELNARGLPWEKQAAYWLTDAQRYQTIYEFSYITKN